MRHLLVIHSDTATRTLLCQRLQTEGHRVTAHPDARESAAAFGAGMDAALLEYGLPDQDTLQVLRALRGIDQGPPIIVLMVPPEHVTAVLRQGAYFCTRTPLNVDEVALLVERAIRGSSHNVHSEIASEAEPRIADLIGESSEIRNVKHAIKSLATSPDTSVLLTGESGTGKDLVARIIHTATERAGRFVGVSCSALPEALVAADLFGTASGNGATVNGNARNSVLERATGGTVLLDDFEALTPTIQAKLLRFLENSAVGKVGPAKNGTSSVRIIVAMSRDIHAGLDDDRLREDLLHRLAVVTINMPPLRERRADIPLLVSHYLTKFAKRFNKRVSRASDGAMSSLQKHYWPGNVRELCNTLERATLMTSDEDTLESTHISFSPASQPPPALFRLPPQGIDFRELEREIVAQALELANGNQTRAALLLHMTRDQVRYRMAKFGINERSVNGAGIHVKHEASP